MFPVNAAPGVAGIVNPVFVYQPTKSYPFFCGVGNGFGNFVAFDILDIALPPFVLYVIV